MKGVHTQKKRHVVTYFDNEMGVPMMMSVKGKIVRCPIVDALKHGSKC